MAPVRVLEQAWSWFEFSAEGFGEYNRSVLDVPTSLMKETVGHNPG